MVTPKHLFHWAYFARIVITVTLGVELYKLFSTPGAASQAQWKLDSSAEASKFVLAWSLHVLYSGM